MTKTEYAEYEASVAGEMAGLTGISSGACSGCEECRDTYGYDEERWKFVCPAEPWFSWYSCEVCGSSLEGDRKPVHAVDENSEILHFEACVDCVYYLEYGRLDDQTMDDLEDQDDGR